MPGSASFYGPVSPQEGQSMLYGQHPPSFIASPIDYRQEQHGPPLGQHAGAHFSAHWHGPSQEHHQPYYNPAAYGNPMQQQHQVSSSAGHRAMLHSPSSPSGPSLSSSGSYGSSPFPPFPPSSHILGLGPPSSVPPAAPPLRSQVGHASTPSFVPPSHVFDQQRHLRPTPIKSPSLIRSGSVSPSLREEKKRKIIVRLPREREEEDQVQDDAVGRSRNTIHRRPMEAEARKSRIEQMDFDEEGGDVPLEAEELVSRGVHFDEVKMNGLPETIDVYLPGNSAWEEVREMIEEQAARRHGRTSFAAPAQRAPFPHPFEAPSFARPSLGRPHARTGSLFSAPQNLPPRLQTAFHSVARGRGHSATASMGSPHAQPFVPSWGLQRSPALIALPESPVVGLRPGHFPLAAPSSHLSTASSLSPQQHRQLTLAELNRGFGTEEEDEQGGLELQQERRTAGPSRRNSGLSVGTGVASVSDILTDDAGSDVLTNTSDDEPLALRAKHLHQGSLGAEALVARRAAMIGQRDDPGGYSCDEGGYDGSEDGEGDSEAGQGLREENEGHNSRDPLAFQQQQGRHANVRQTAMHRDSLGDVLFKAPSDIDRSPIVETAAAEQGSHKIIQHFAFPPKTPPRGLLPPTRGKDSDSLHPTPSIARFDLAVDGRFSPSPEPPSATRMLNVAAPEFVFGAVVASPVSFARKESSASLNSIAFGPLGGPGSLTVDTPTPTSASPSPSINPYAPEFVPSYAATNPDPPTRSPPVSATLPRPSTFDFQPPSNAPTLVIPISPPSTRAPLPPVPLTIVEPQPAHAKRQKLAVEGGSERAAASSISSQVPHSLHHLSPDKRRDGNGQGHGDETDEGPSPSVSNGDSQDDPLPEQYSPSHALGRRPFTLRPAASFSADGRIVGFSTGTVRRATIPHFASEEGLRSNSLSVMNGSRKQEARQPSGDDIAVPNASRPISHAIAIPQPAEHPISAEAEPRDRVHSAQLDSSSGGEGSSSDEEDGDDYPLRILEDLISTQFDGLRQELSSLTSFDVKQDSFIDAVVGRLEAVVARPRSAVDDSRLVQALGVKQKEQTDALLGALQSLQTSIDAAPSAIDTSDLFAEIKQSIAALKPLKLDADDPVFFRLALAIQPQINGLVERLGDSTSTSVVEQLRPLLNRSISAPSSTDFLDTIVARLEPLFDKISGGAAPDSSAAVVARGAGEVTAEDWSARFDLLERLLKAAKEEEAEAEERKTNVQETPRQLERSDEGAWKEMKEMKVMAASMDRTVELESQLAQARSDHLAISNETAVLAERLSSEQARHTAEVESLQEQLHEQEQLKSGAAAEKSTLQQTIARLQVELASSQATAHQLASQAAELKEKVALSHAKELKHVADIAKQQAKARIVEAAAESSKTRVDGLQAELDQVRSQLAVSEASRVEAVTEAGAYRERFAAFEVDLVRMKEEVARELDETSDKLASLAQERDAVTQQRNELRAELDSLRSATIFAPPPVLSYSYSSGDDDEDVVSHVSVAPSSDLSRSVKLDDSGWWSSSFP